MAASFMLMKLAAIGASSSFAECRQALDQC
jgi:hypothetical protein